jgi:hypothetical protein
VTLENLRQLKLGVSQLEERVLEIQVIFFSEVMFLF